jgi:integrase
VLCRSSTHGKPVKVLRKSWWLASEAAGYPGRLFHDFRRSAVRTLEGVGRAALDAMAMVGHRTESVYRRYAIVDEAMHREAAAQLDVRASSQATKAATARAG